MVPPQSRNPYQDVIFETAAAGLPIGGQKTGIRSTESAGTGVNRQPPIFKRDLSELETSFSPHEGRSGGL